MFHKAGFGEFAPHVKTYLITLTLWTHASINHLDFSLVQTCANAQKHTLECIHILIHTDTYNKLYIQHIQFCEACLYMYICTKINNYLLWLQEIY